MNDKEIKKIVEEFDISHDKLKDREKIVSIFGSSRISTSHPQYKLANELALSLSNNGYDIATGGAMGIMEAASMGAYKGESNSIALNIELDHAHQVKNDYQNISLDFEHFFIRKQTFIKYSCAFIAFAGGFGTLDELTEVLALIHTKKLKPKPIILVGSQFFEPLLKWFENTLLAENLIGPNDIQLLTIVDTTKEVLDIIDMCQND